MASETEALEVLKSLGKPFIAAVWGRPSLCVTYGTEAEVALLLAELVHESVKSTGRQNRAEFIGVIETALHCTKELLHDRTG